MLWYPAEVSGLPRAGQQVHTVQAERESKSAISTEGHLKAVMGSELLREAVQHTGQRYCTFQTPCEVLNRILQNTIIPGLISLAAEDSNDRSTLACYIAASFLVQSSSNVSIIDGTGSFDAVKLLHVLQHLKGDDSIHSPPSADEIAILDRVQVSRVFDFEGLEQTISELTVRRAARDSSEIPAMIIIDDIASIVGPQISKDRIYGFAQLEKLTLDMRKITIQQHIVFLLLNSVTRTFEMNASGLQANTEPVQTLSRSFADMMDSSLLLSKTRHIVGQSHTKSQILRTVKSASGSRHQAAVFLFGEGHELRGIP